MIDFTYPNNIVSMDFFGNILFMRCTELPIFFKIMHVYKMCSTDVEEITLLYVADNSESVIKVVMSNSTIKR